MKRFLLLFSTFVLTAVSPAAAFSLSNFEAPKSVIVDPEDGSYYVSNSNGTMNEKDGNGYISKISSSGSIVIQKFMGGRKDELSLNAPKGMAIVGRTLYVTDVDTVKGFDRKTRKPSVVVDLSKFRARFLNDLVADAQGALYVSDTMTNRIFKIDTKDGHKASVYLESQELGSPSGLLFNPKSKNLMAVTWETGRILEIDPSRRVHVLKRGLHTLDGIDFDSAGNLYVSSFEKGEIYLVPNYGRGVLSVYQQGLTSPADIAYDRKKNELLVPSFKGNRVVTIRKP